MVAEWLQHPDRLKEYSDNSRSMGRPRAALDIAETVGSKLLKIVSSIDVEPLEAAM